ncbi:CshA/CshB family fibrillar adhesin-related protein [Stenotrophomonas tuberculopleuritidis]|uniref:CshA/CshB family fibrillar adhesin-related protein n=1 Tax=Stenotrophomonas tuberculopleuritidis TaxID=3055079 RepID=UPI0026E58E43|nr:CshA/CshB family fibrillar adhesin-related protein [Stenotrophomonas sp. 704A1]
MWQSTTSRIRAGGESVHPEKTARRRGGRLLAAGLLLLLAAVSPSLAWAAAYATGGSSPYRNTVLWLTWGGGSELGTPGVTLNNGDTSSISMPVAAGVNLEVSCSLANIGGGGALQSYRPGAFSGDSLDDLYNVGGSGGSNRLIAGIVRNGGASTFEINCVSTLGGAPYRLRGVVMADAESINNSGEFVEASALGTWNVVEMRKNLGAGPYNVTKSSSGANSVVRFGPGNDNNTAAVTFLNFDDAAHAPGNLAVNMGFSIRGSGATAIAIGLLVPYADFGDAPASYGDAMHVVDDLQFRPDGLAVNGTATNINTATYAPGGLAPPLTDFLGTVGPDTEQKSSYSADAKGDDNFPAGNPNEENAWPASYRLTVMQAGTQISQPVACVGNGSVAGWIDFNRNGTFDAGERSTTAACSGGQASLSWTVPSQVSAGTSYVRLRYATNPAQIQQPTGVADDGEVEDHLITITAPALKVVKDNNATAGIWNYGQAGTQYTLTVSNTSDVPTGNPPNVPAGVITVRDQLPTGIVPAWTGSHSSGTWSCTASGQALTCTSSQVLAAAGSAGDSSAFTVPVTVTAAATGLLRNHASVGGGYDPFNGGNPPAPGEGCTDANHCARSDVTVPGTRVGYAKRANTAGPVAVGATVSYTVDVTIADGNTRDLLTLTDTLGTGLDFASVTSAGAFTCNAANPLVCTLPAGTVPGSYSLTYAATVNAQASGQVVNTVVGTSTDTPTCSSTCTTTTPVAAPRISVSKASATAGPVAVGDSVAYTVSVTVADARTTAPTTLTDTLGTGLDFGSLSNAGGFSCVPGNPLVCTLPAGTVPGTYAFSYTGIVNAQASGQVRNAVVPSGPDNPACVGSCDTSTPLATPLVSYAKQVSTGGPVRVGDSIGYTLSVTVARSRTTDAVTLTDTLGSGLDFGSVTSAGAFTCNAANPLVCTLPAGTVPGTYSLAYTATVNAQASGTVRNAVLGTGTDTPTCTANCDTTTPVATPGVSYAKAVNSTGPVSVGDSLTYTLTTVVTNSRTTDVVTLTDTLGNGLDFGTVTSAGAYTCTGANPLVCTLPAGTAPGSYSLSYTAVVNAQASGQVTNAVLGSGGDTPGCTANCDTTTPVTGSAIDYRKTSAAAGAVKVGDSIAYTLTAVVSHSRTTAVFNLTDTMGAGLDFGAVTAATGFSCNAANPLLCTLPAGTVPGTYTVNYTATVNAQAKGSVSNAVLGSGTGTNTCTTDCTTTTPVLAATVTYRKSSSTVAPVSIGDAVDYSVEVVVANSQTTDAVTLTDTLGTGLALQAVTQPGPFTCNGSNPLVCTLPAATVPGTYTLGYRALVTAEATGSVRNAVLGGGGDTPSCSGTCTTEHALAEPRVVLQKKSGPASGSEVRPGDRLDYTLQASIERAALRQPLQLVDTPDAGLTIDALPAGCARQGADIVCTLPAGTPVGVHTFVYPAIVNQEARTEVFNRLRGQYPDGAPPPECGTCETRHKVISDFALRITKSASPRRVKVGDLVRYQLVVENVGSSHWRDGVVVDTPPPGFSYVDGSMRVADDDAAFSLGGSQSPLRIGAVDIAVGRTATISYLLRVGAGVRAGTHINQAVATGTDGSPLSNVATAEVGMDADPLLEDSLVFGTVFDDRDGDGWQDSAELTGVRVQGGFAAAAYVPGSTTLDRGDGPQPLADASAPLLHGVQVGVVHGRASTSDTADTHQVVIRQRLRELAFTDDFVLQSAQGHRLQLDAQGASSLRHSGEAAKGLTAAEPAVHREIARVADGYEVAYVIRNQGIQEQGIPGVRLATVEGLLIETDPFGRYHLADVHGGDARLGRNFIVKLDPATVPAGAALTTENPLLRRVTQGVPTRFSFGVRLPPSPQAAAERAELALGEVLFAAGSSELRAGYRPVLAKMAEVVDRYQGGDVVILANGESQALAFARAVAVRDALQEAVAEGSRAGLTVQLRTDVADPHSLLAGVDAGGALLGNVLFDTDKAVVREEFKPLLAAIAARLEALGGGQVSLVGHTDVRGSHAYNQALGLRRASAVFEALRSQLSPAVQQRLRVRNEETAATRAAARQQEARR